MQKQRGLLAVTVPGEPAHATRQSGELHLVSDPAGGCLVDLDHGIRPMNGRQPRPGRIDCCEGLRFRKRDKPSPARDLPDVGVSGPAAPLIAAGEHAVGQHKDAGRWRSRNPRRPKRSNRLGAKNAPRGIWPLPASGLRRGPTRSGEVNRRGPATGHHPTVPSRHWWSRTTGGQGHDRSRASRPEKAIPCRPEPGVARRAYFRFRRADDGAASRSSGGRAGKVESVPVPPDPRQRPGIDRPINLPDQPPLWDVP